MQEPHLTIGELASVYWPILVCSFVASLVATPLCRRFALSKGIVDRPDDWLKPHKKPVPYLGGVAIFVGWSAGVVLAVLLFPDNGGREGGAVGTPTMYRGMMLAVLVAGAAIMLIGLCDDLLSLSPRTKLVTNIAVVFLLISFGVGDDVVLVVARHAGVTLDRWLLLTYSIPITVFVVVGACNAANLIDGVDGLCSGVFGVISAGFLVLAAYLHLWADWQPFDVQRVVLALALLGAAMGFLPFNRAPAKIFLGDAGSMLLGLNAAILLLLFAKQGSLRWVMGAIMVFGLPIVDMSLTLVRRWRCQKPLMQGDRSHFYDQLIDRGMSVRGVVAISYVLAGSYAVLGCMSIFLRIRYAIALYLAVVVLTAAVIGAAKMVQAAPPRTKATPGGKCIDLLFTSVGRRVSLIREFRRAADDLGVALRIHATDRQASAPALQEADERLIVPGVKDDDYCGQLIAYCRRQGINALIPLIDPELQPLADARDRFAEVGTRVIISSPDTVRTCVDKVRSNAFLGQHGFLTPRILSGEELASPEFPLFLKPKIGSSSLGAYKINTSQDLAYYRGTDPDSIVQEFVDGVEYTVDVFADFDGRPRCAVPRLRHEVRGGEVSKGQAIQNLRMMKEHCRLVQTLGGCQGVVTIQCFLTPSDDIVFIEINPRFGGGVPLSIQAGADTPRWILELLLGREPDIRMDGWTDGLYMLRFDQGIFVPPSAFPTETVGIR